ncbi:hypothetical protein EPN42_11130 [bacterium]|nr:MAG: hypothetical protein EPN42_11130 [bacterium]
MLPLRGGASQTVPAAIPIAAAAAVSSLVYGLVAAMRDERRRRRWSMTCRLREMDGLAFERHVAKTYRTYRTFGYRAELTKASGDQGADVVGGELRSVV